MVKRPSRAGMTHEDVRFNERSAPGIGIWKHRSTNRQTTNERSRRGISQTGDLSFYQQLIDPPVDIFLIVSYFDEMEKGSVRPNSLQDRLEKRIARKRGDVFLRADFDDLGGYDQVGRALSQLVEKGRLLKVGYGIYARACPSILDGTPVPTKGMRELAAEALGRLGVETAPTRWDEANASGKSTQVPTGRVIGVRGRVRRKISYNGVPLKYERLGPPPR